MPGPATTGRRDRLPSGERLLAPVAAGDGPAVAAVHGRAPPRSAAAEPEAVKARPEARKPRTGSGARQGHGGGGDGCR
jgi:hypothetical protein